MGKVFVFGIDGASPELVFDAWLEDLPNIRKLISSGIHGKLNSTIPPITILAWNSMFSGKDPSQIGLFGYTFLDQEGKSQIVNSTHVKTPLIWDMLGSAGKRTVSLFVPLTYPVRPINGCMVSDFLTPGINSNCAYPSSLKEKIKELGNSDIFFDVAVGLAGHKGLELGVLADRTIEMTNMQLALSKNLLITQPWDLFITVMIGSDRLQHMAWNHFDEHHRKFVPHSTFKDVLKKYYIHLDKKLGEMISLLDEDTTIIVASDHGMVRQEGKININDWLMENGYLILKQEFQEKIKQNALQGKKTKFDASGIDWEQTTAYGSGAYHARIYINKKKTGKEYGKVRDRLAQQMKQIRSDTSKELKTIVYTAEEVYADPHVPECPDLTVYFDELRWASNPDFGNKGLHSWDTAMGADSAGHSPQGCFIISGKNIRHHPQQQVANIAQMAPTILTLLGVKIPPDILVKPLNLKS